MEADDYLFIVHHLEHTSPILSVMPLLTFHVHQILPCIFRMKEKNRKVERKSLKFPNHGQEVIPSKFFRTQLISFTCFQCI